MLQLSMYCLEDIVKREELNTRRNVLRRWIVIARECLRINNYSSVLALVAALEHTCVHRLKKTWAAIGDDITAVYAELSPFTGSNYVKLKEMVRNGPRPCLPYLGMRTILTPGDGRSLMSLHRFVSNGFGVPRGVAGQD